MVNIKKITLMITKIKTNNSIIFYVLINYLFHKTQPEKKCFRRHQ